MRSSFLEESTDWQQVFQSSNWIKFICNKARIKKIM